MNKFVSYFTCKTYIKRKVSLETKEVIWIKLFIDKINIHETNVENIKIILKSPK